MYKLGEDTYLGMTPQASVYMDACFLLDFYSLPIESGVTWTDKQCTFDESLDEIITNINPHHLFISNHVAAEVLHNIFKTSLLGDLELAAVESIKGKVDPDDYINHLTAKALLKEAKSLFTFDVVTSLTKGKSIVLRDLLKVAKINLGANRKSLTSYYDYAKLEYELLITRMEERFGRPIEILSSATYEHGQALGYMNSLQLEAYDAFHYAIAATNHVTFFITMDGDFPDANLYAQFNKTRILNVS